MNGTRVNGKSISLHWLSRGDRISVGPVGFTFVQDRVPDTVVVDDRSLRQRRAR